MLWRGLPSAVRGAKALMGGNTNRNISRSPGLTCVNHDCFTTRPQPRDATLDSRLPTGATEGAAAGPQCAKIPHTGYCQMDLPNGTPTGFERQMDLPKSICLRLYAEMQMETFGICPTSLDSRRGTAYTALCDRAPARSRRRHARARCERGSTSPRRLGAPSGVAVSWLSLSLPTILTKRFRCSRAFG